jgi:hypothetical protein
MTLADLIIIVRDGWCLLSTPTRDRTRQEQEEKGGGEKSGIHFSDSHRRSQERKN